jgi:RNA polymerase subunit RPABC4/transcription elongation factor Spt4
MMFKLEGMMSSIQKDSGFKYVFWGVLILCFFGFFAQSAFVLMGGLRPFWDIFGIRQYGHAQHFCTLTPRFVASMLPTITLCVIWVLVVAPLVYKDAKKRGMDPWLWATVATFVPFFIGIIIYLVARSNGRASCESCGRPIRSDFKACPYCGHTREHVCPQCSRPVSPDWKLCPYCEHKLGERGVASEAGA